MTTKSGIGGAFFYDGYDISGDVGSIGTIRASISPLDVTPINVSGMKRITGRKSGELNWNVFFNDAASQEHVALKSLTRTDHYGLWAQSCAAIGDVGAAMLGKQVNYDWQFGADGGAVGSVQMLSNGAPLEFVELLTPGKRTDTTATNGASLDGGAATTYGLAAYAFLTAFSGTNITLTLEDSANNSAFAAITGGAFTAFTGIGAQRIQTAVGGTVRRYVRVVSSGTFTSATFVVVFVRYHITQPLYA
mgnify:FL=1|jgi:hypothetical protein